jgi:BirA family biotin operon repressor/biotin-[acetyl-CoA-carboxylase] ligase
VVSGEKLSRLLNVSRTAVWKQIKTLKMLGYKIAAVPSQGYRLISSPDLLIPAEIAASLTTIRIGSEIICFRETDSTNALAFKLAEEGAVEGTVVIADAQRRGKGRIGREWESPPGVNLYCSIILRPPIPPVAAFQITFLSAIAVARSVSRCALLEPSIKWPNDILVNGGKVAGLLNEMSAETEKVNFIVLGIGVNLNMRRDQFPQNLRHPASSLLLEGGVEINRTGFIRDLLMNLDALYDGYLRDGYAPIRDEWLAMSRMAGRRVRVTDYNRSTEGMVRGIDDNGALILECAGGGMERVLTGDVMIQ